MTLAEFTEARVSGYVPFQDRTPGFMLPVVSYPGQPGRWLIQEVDEYTNSVSAFRPMNGLVSSTVIPIRGPSVRIGGAVVHAFVADTGAVHTGTAQELEPLLRAFLAQHPDEAAVAVQVAELVGTSDEKRSARARMRRAVLEQTGPTSARAFYEGSTLRLALWDRLLAAAPDANAARRIAASRPQLKVTIGVDGAIAVDLSALAPEDVAQINVAEVIAELEREFDVSAGDVAESMEAEAPPPRPEPNLELSVTRALDRIKRAGRQEERLAIVIDEFLADREVGEAILSRYHDRAKLASWALRELGLQCFGLDPSFTQTELVAASMIPKLFTNCYPMNRGWLLYCLAKHLAKYPIVNTTIRQTLNRSVSIYVEWDRPQILALLDGKSLQPLPPAY